MQRGRHKEDCTLGCFRVPVSISVIMWLVGAYMTESDIKAATRRRLSPNLAKTGTALRHDPVLLPWPSRTIVASVGVQFWVMAVAWLLSMVVWSLEQLEIVPNFFACLAE